MSDTSGLQPTADSANESVRTLEGACLGCGRAFRINPRHHDEHKFCSARCRARWHRERRECDCGCGATLSAQQKRFSSRECSYRWYDAVHPRLNVVPPEGRRPTSLKVAILNLMLDGVWRTKLEIAALVRSEPHSVGTRLSELDRMGRRTGQWVIESDGKVGNTTRPHRFRLVVGRGDTA